MKQFNNISPAANQHTASDLRGNHQTRIRASLLALLTLSGCKPNNELVLPGLERTSPLEASQALRKETQLIMANPNARILPMPTCALEHSIGIRNIRVLNAEPMHAADNSEHNFSLQTAEPLLIPLSRSLDGDGAYLKPIPGSTNITTTSYNITILLDAPLLQALATGRFTSEKADPQNYLESPGLHHGWQEAAPFPAKKPDIAKQYIPFPIQGLRTELLDPQGQPFGTVLSPRTFSGQTIELTVVLPGSFEAELTRNPGLHDYSLVFDVSYIGATKETAKSSIALSEEIIRKIAADLTSKQHVAGENISLSSEDETKSRIKQSIMRAISADGSAALRLLQDSIADQLTGRIYEFLMKRGERIQIAMLDTSTHRQDILNYLQKIFSKPIFDKISKREAEMCLYHFSKDKQWERLDHSNFEEEVSTSAGLA